jgi:transposase
LAYILTLEDAERFEHSRDVGPFLGLKPKERDSGDSHPQLGITKTGDGLLRSLLVQGAHCMLRKGAPDSDLGAWGLAKMKSGGKNAKKRAIVAVARKLAVLLHALWSTGEVYDPLYNRKAAQAAKSKGQIAA